MRSTLLPTLFLASSIAVATPSHATQAAPPLDATVVRAELERVARANRIPSVILEGLAWQASQWQQFDPATGTAVETQSGRVGILSVPVEERTDAERLRADWRYNLAEGAKLLVHAWNRAPLPGTSRLDAGRNILECWYPALGWYGTGGKEGFRGREGDAAHTYADQVFDAIASGGNGHWMPVSLSRHRPAALAWGRNWLAPPAPWHYGDVPARPQASVVVDLPVPYLQQAWDVPDGFDGSGSCGPSSTLMVLLWAGKMTPKPIAVRDSYAHTSPYGAAIPGIHSRICSPRFGAVHSRMLVYLRPYFPGVAIFYNGKANWKRVQAELDAGRPVMLGTEVTPAGHLMVARGYLSDGRLIVNDPAGDREQFARVDSPDGPYSATGSRYWNGGGNGAVYDWEALDVRWIMTFGPTRPADADPAEDEDLLQKDN